MLGAGLLLALGLGLWLLRLRLLGLRLWLVGCWFLSSRRVLVRVARGRPPRRAEESLKHLRAVSASEHVLHFSEYAVEVEGGACLCSGVECGGQSDDRYVLRGVAAPRLREHQPGLGTWKRLHQNSKMLVTLCRIKSATKRCCARTSMSWRASYP